MPRLSNSKMRRKKRIRELKRKRKNELRARRNGTLKNTEKDEN